MLRSRIPILAGAVLAAVAACDRGAGGEAVARDTVISTIPTEDTVVVERTIIEDTIRAPEDLPPREP